LKSIVKIGRFRVIVFALVFAMLILVSSIALAFIDYSQHKLINLSGEGENPELKYSVVLTKYEKNLFGQTSEKVVPNTKFRLFQSLCPANTLESQMEKCRADQIASGQEDKQILSDSETDELGQIHIYNLPFPVEYEENKFKSGASGWYYFTEVEEAPMHSKDSEHFNNGDLMLDGSTCKESQIASGCEYTLNNYYFKIPDEPKRGEIVLQAFNKVKPTPDEITPFRISKTVQPTCKVPENHINTTSGDTTSSKQADDNAKTGNSTSSPKPEPENSSPPNSSTTSSPAVTTTGSASAGSIPDQPSASPTSTGQKIPDEPNPAPSTVQEPKTADKIKPAADECERNELTDVQKGQLFAFKVHFYAPDDVEEKHELYFNYHLQDDEKKVEHYVPRVDNDSEKIDIDGKEMPIKANTIYLKHGQVAVFDDVPIDLHYRIEEDRSNFKPDDNTIYNPQIEQTSGIVVKPEQVEEAEKINLVKFVNQIVDETSPLGSLEITNTVQDTSGGLAPDHIFEYDYCIGPGESKNSDTQIPFTAADSPIDFKSYAGREQDFFGCHKFVLKAGESIKFINIPPVYNFSKLPGYENFEDKNYEITFVVDQQNAKYFTTVGDNPVSGIIAGDVHIYVINRFELPTCEAGYHFDIDKDSCVPDNPTPPEPPICPTGEHLENGVCVPDGPTPPVPPTCPSGQHVENGACVPDSPTPPPPIKCPVNYTLVGDKCVPNGTPNIPQPDNKPAVNPADLARTGVFFLIPLLFIILCLYLGFGTRRRNALHKRTG
jgi:hypothetical protein